MVGINTSTDIYSGRLRFEKKNDRESLEGRMGEKEKKGRKEEKGEKREEKGIVVKNDRQKNREGLIKYTPLNTSNIIDG